MVGLQDSLTSADYNLRCVIQFFPPQNNIFLWISYKVNAQNGCVLANQLWVQQCSGVQLVGLYKY